jgi:hypothetical protein
MLSLRNPDTRFEIAGDKTQFDVIVRDMCSHGGTMAPSDHWNWNLGESVKGSNGYTSDLFEKNYSHLNKMLDPWVGVTGMKVLSPEAVTKYEAFLRPIDHLQLLPTDVLTHGRANGWRETDLGSVLDLNLIWMFRVDVPNERLAICEVGGGYGRLAEVFLGQRRKPIHYVMIDAVPGSLLYAYAYLKAQYPDLKIGSFYAGDAYDASYDCYVLPAWRTGALPQACFDVCVNIESMQEMEQHHVDSYLELFDRLTVPGGEIYLSNARDYVFKGQWKIPRHWETLYLNNTPRSWTADHPTHILRKSAGDHSQARRAHESVFRQQVHAWRCP